MIQTECNSTIEFQDYLIYSSSLSKSSLSSLNLLKTSSTENAKMSATTNALTLQRDNRYTTFAESSMLSPQSSYSTFQPRPPSIFMADSQSIISQEGETKLPKNAPSKSRFKRWNFKPLAIKQQIETKLKRTNSAKSINSNKSVDFANGTKPMTKSNTSTTSTTTSTTTNTTTLATAIASKPRPIKSMLSPSSPLSTAESNSSFEMHEDESDSHSSNSGERYGSPGSDTGSVFSSPGRIKTKQRNGFTIESQDIATTAAATTTTEAATETSTDTNLLNWHNSSNEKTWEAENLQLDIDDLDSILLDFDEAEILPIVDVLTIKGQFSSSDVNLTRVRIPELVPLL